MFSGTYSSHRFSPLKQITTDNVAKLRPAWVYQPPGSGSVESTPVVANGVMYVTSGPTMVAALDLKSGKALWEWTRPIAPSVLYLGFPRVNRGVAVLDNMVYVGTLDGYLFALDARAGIERWSVHVGENPTGHSITAAPLVVDDKVIVGVSGGEAGHPRIPRRLRREDRQAGVALLHRSRRRANRAARPGAATAGSTAAARPGSPAPTIRSSSCSTGAPAIPVPTGTATRARATISTPRRWSRSTSTPASCAGISSSRRTTRTTGTRTRCRCSSTPQVGGRRARSSSPPTATASITCSIGRPASSSRDAIRQTDVGQGARRSGRPIEIAGHGAD